MILGDFHCRCCGEGALTKRLWVAVNEMLELIPLDCDLVIHSGFRCVSHNKDVGGSPFSKHLLGEAIDFHIHNMELIDSLYIAESVEFFYNGGIGFYYSKDSEWIHADVRDTGRARWVKRNGILINDHSMFS